VNDLFGHHEGDLVLQNIAVLLTTKYGNRCYRYGGEEFVVLLHHLDGDQAFQEAEGLRRQIAQDIHIKQTEMLMTVSIGIATYPTLAYHYFDLIEKADIAMYVAKNAGKNSCLVYCDSHNVSTMSIE